MRISNTTSWIRCWRGRRKRWTWHRRACPHKAWGRLRSSSCKSTVRQHAGTSADSANTDHHRRKRSPERTTAGGWMIRDSQGRRLQSKHGRHCFAQAWQRRLQGTSETQTEPPPEGSTNSTELLFCRSRHPKELSIRLPAAARKLTFRRLSGPLDVSRQQAGTMQQNMHRRSTGASTRPVLQGHWL